MKRAIALACLAMLTACGGGGGGAALPIAPSTKTPEAAKNPEPAAPVTPPVCTVETDGDSIMWGQDVQPGTTTLLRLASPPAVTLKRIRPAYTVDDRSVGGQMATERVASFLNEHHASRFVVIQHGTNDLYRGTIPDMVVALKAIVTFAQAGRSTVILTGMSPIDSPRYPEFRDAVKQVAVDTGALYADWPSVAVKTSDGIHPDQVSSEALVEKLAGTLDIAAPECSATGSQP